MNLLLDTHVFLWYISDDPRLRREFRDQIRNPGNEVYLSVVSLWETILKHQLGKLPLPEAPATFLPKQRDAHLIQSLSLDEQAVARLGGLPSHHRDPFDRILVCQAQQHGMTMVTVDPKLRAYPVKIL